MKVSKRWILDKEDDGDWQQDVLSAIGAEEDNA